MAAVRAPAVPPIKLTTQPFPDPYPMAVTPDPKLQRALDQAIAAGPGMSWRSPVALVSLNPDGSRPLGQFKGSEEHYSGSLLKVCALYAAYELRRTMQNIAGELGAAATPTSFLGQAGKYLNPLIMTRVGTIPLLKGIALKYALPKYPEMFTVTAASGGVNVDLSTTYMDRVRLMIGPSSNSDARQCIHDLGYGYLNGCLVAGGFFDIGTNTGLWLAGDYSRGDNVPGYPYFEVQSLNDRGVGQAATVLSSRASTRWLMTARWRAPMEAIAYWIR